MTVVPVVIGGLGGLVLPVPRVLAGRVEVCYGTASAVSTCWRVEVSYGTASTVSTCWRVEDSCSGTMVTVVRSKALTPAAQGETLESGFG